MIDGIKNRRLSRWGEIIVVDQTLASSTKIDVSQSKVSLFLPFRGEMSGFSRADLQVLSRLCQSDFLRLERSADQTSQSLLHEVARRQLLCFVGAVNLGEGVGSQRQGLFFLGFDGLAEIVAVGLIPDVVHSGISIYLPGLFAILDEPAKYGLIAYPKHALELEDAVDEGKTRGRFPLPQKALVGHQECRSKPVCLRLLPFVLLLLFDVEAVPVKDDMTKFVGNGKDPTLHGDAIVDVDHHGGTTVLSSHGEPEEGIGRRFVGQYLDAPGGQKSTDVADRFVLRDSEEFPDLGGCLLATLTLGQ